MYFHHYHHHNNPVRCVRLDLVVIAWLLAVEDLLFWTLASSWTLLFHNSLLSCANVVASFSVRLTVFKPLSIHFWLALPGLFFNGITSFIAILGSLVSSIRVTWPNHTACLIFTRLRMSLLSRWLIFARIFSLETFSFHLMSRILLRHLNVHVGFCGLIM